jgi:hypothetical protein
MSNVLGYAVVFVLMTVLQWVILLIAVPIAQRLMDFSLPLWPERTWKLAVVAAGVTLASMLLSPLHVPLLPMIGSVLVLWAMMARWFDVGPASAFVVSLVSGAMSYFLALFVLAGAMH